ncbi:MAG: leucyl/phenylalanyl-tRNA--protein transferase [Bacteroidales bacterium]|jgi:leucyl/phenylalanyl-tRNA--protein transferase|nr:leucyl/phenylalanyl-tRNA--protein transferase [Bacteroidales bacterium]
MKVFLDGNEDDIYFPNPLDDDSVVGDDVIAIGGSLSPERLIEAYKLGIFPFYAFRYKPSVWVCPLIRFCIFPNEIHVSHSMRTLLNSGKYRVTFNQAFEEVICGCSETDGRNRDDMAWLGDEIIEAYTTLHRMGRASSVEVWEGDLLVGGLYGVKVGRVFCGESMFSRRPSASKVALISLAREMLARGWQLIDCQYETPHLKSMGGRHIGYGEYIRILNQYLDR